ncbi:MAG: CRISPR-associated endonuclease Cas2 [Mediterranea sp.]|jgi:CRISPR-associated protein Cas2|nr:CRISPR-associated endonuclease Cas2 [Mediterranea sp.]
MPRKKKEIPLAEMLGKIRSSGLCVHAPLPLIDAERSSPDGLPSIEERVRQLFGLINRKHSKLNMTFFVMYDIENNRIRNLIVKYLIRKGCVRVQKSIFLADTSHEVYAEIRDSLAEVQAQYDNHDSIIVCPISTDLLRSMRVIGKNIDVDIVLKTSNTLFF